MIAHFWLISAPIVAQSAAKAPGGFGSYPLLLDAVLIAAMFYFLLWRPQKTQRKQKEEMLRKLKKGDEVTTSGGIVGEVIHIKETVKDGASAPAMDDRVTIKSAESRLVVERGSVTRVSSKAADAGGGTS